MRILRTVFVFLFIFIVILFASKKSVLGAYTADEVLAGRTEEGYILYPPNDGCLGCAGTLAGSYAPGQDYSGFYEWPPDSNNYFAIGLPVVPEYGGGGGGGGPEDDGTGTCTGVYANCGEWFACSPTCGPGTQDRTCFDTGCGAPQIQSQACQTNDPNVWGDPVTACTVNCGTGTWDKVNQCGTTQSFACNASACPAWTKLKDSSFISTNSLFNMISLTPQAYDADDTTEQFFIVGQAGLVAAPGISLDISTVNLTAKTGNPEYKVIYTPNSNLMTPALFLSYIKARKEYKVITDLGEITGSGIYVFNGDVSIDSGSSPFNTAGKIVLISTGTVAVDRVAPSTTFTPGGSVAIIAPTINFNGNLTEATGIFIGNTVSTGTNAAQGLKIIGNLIAQTTLSNNREWPTTSRPSLFIKFDQTKYINLLPYLSTASYQWRQIQ